MTADFYDLLDIDTDAPQSAVKTAFRDRVRIYHPDVNDDDRAHAQFTALKKAYDILSDPVERQAYDRLGHETYVAKRTSGIPSPDAWATNRTGDSTTDATTDASTVDSGSTKSASTATSSSTTEPDESATGADTSASQAGGTSSQQGTSSSGRATGDRSSTNGASSDERRNPTADQPQGGTTTRRTRDERTTGSATRSTRSTGASATGNTTSADTTTAATNSSTDAGSGRTSSNKTPPGASASTSTAAGSGTDSGGYAPPEPNPVVRWWNRQNFSVPLLWLSILVYVVGLAHFVATTESGWRTVLGEVTAAGTDTDALLSAVTESRHGIETPLAYVSSVELVSPPLDDPAWVAALAGLLALTILAIVVVRLRYYRLTWQRLTINETILLAVAVGAATTLLGGPLLAGAVLLPMLFGVIVYRTRQLPGWAPSYLFVLGVCAPLVGLSANAAGVTSLAVDLLAFGLVPLAAAFGLLGRLAIRRRFSR